MTYTVPITQVAIFFFIFSFLEAVVLFFIFKKSRFNVWDEDTLRSFIQRKKGKHGEIQCGLHWYETRSTKPAWLGNGVKTFLVLHYDENKKFSNIRETSWVPQPKIIFVALTGISSGLLDVVVNKRGALLNIRIREDTGLLDFSGANCG
jgi:hypothetical protein